MHLPKKSIRKILDFLVCAVGLGTVFDKKICWFSERFWDAHDYWTHKGGTGIPCHFTEYTCWQCGKEFKI